MECRGGAGGGGGGSSFGGPLGGSPWYVVLAGGALLGACAAAAVAVTAGRLRVVVVVDDGAPRLPARLRGPGVVQSVDCHCGGLPARVVLAGAPLAGEEAMSCAARRERLMREHDGFRRLMLQEPRGYPCQNLDIVYPPTRRHPEASFSFVIAENHFVYPFMSGHNLICVVTALLELNRTLLRSRPVWPQFASLTLCSCAPSRLARPPLSRLVRLRPRPRARSGAHGSAREAD
jgi:hypothetical protein